MKLTSYEHWLGRNNSVLVSDISQTLRKGKPCSVSNYSFFVVDHEPVQVNYSIRRLGGDAPSKSNSLGVPDSNRRKSSVHRVSARRSTALAIEQITTQNYKVPLGAVLILELAMPNRYMMEQLGK